MSADTAEKVAGIFIVGYILIIGGVACLIMGVLWITSPLASLRQTQQVTAALNHQ